MKYRVVQFANNAYALEKVSVIKFLWWKWEIPTGTYRDLVSEGFHWNRGAYLSLCTSYDKNKMLDLADFYNSNDNGAKVITRTPLEKLL